MKIDLIPLEIMFKIKAKKKGKEKLYQRHIQYNSTNVEKDDINSKLKNWKILFSEESNKGKITNYTWKINWYG